MREHEPVASDADCVCSCVGKIIIHRLSQVTLHCYVPGISSFSVVAFHTLANLRQYE